MADARLTIKFRWDFTDAIRQLRQAADELEALQGTDDQGDVVDQHTDPDLIGDMGRG
ncbi:hypothetical protein ACFXPN_42490 [Streptomyces griseorubiginosus]|uniref:hypothetical protein n=1 Tax=Streptomyces griseorubiginosus TaxID=67304 RepID=UPI0036A4AB79